MKQKISQLYFNLLRKDGCLKLKNLPRTTAQMLHFLWGSRGVGWHILYYGFGYASPGFHPWNKNNRHLMDKWLSENQQYLKELSV